MSVFDDMSPEEKELWDGLSRVEQISVVVTACFENLEEVIGKGEFVIAMHPDHGPDEPCNGVACLSNTKNASRAQGLLAKAILTIGRDNGIAAHMPDPEDTKH